MTPADLGTKTTRLEPQSFTRRLANGDIKIRYVAVTPVLKYRDDVDLLVHPIEDGGCVLAAYSRSRLGLYDFGTNRARLQDLFGQLRAADDEPGWIR
jgi:uncharacterized protein (DUF1499 family)